MIKFAIPGLYEHFSLIHSLVLIKEQRPEIFYDWDFGAIYGNFQFCIWDGGRVFQNYEQASIEQVKYVIDFFKEKQIPIRFIFTNPVIEPHHCYDRFCNLVCELAEDNKNEIVVNSAILETYLRTSYPKYSFISSTTKCLTKPEDSLDELAKDYKYVCLDYNLNKNEKFLQSIPVENLSKTEILVNAICPPGCPSRKQHYLANGLSVLSYGKQYGIDCYIGLESPIHPKVINYHNNFSLEEIYDIYPNKYHIDYFKLEGRTFDELTLALVFAQYLVKKEYQLDFIDQIMSASFDFQPQFQNIKKIY